MHPALVTIYHAVYGMHMSMSPTPRVQISAIPEIAQIFYSYLPFPVTPCNPPFVNLHISSKLHFQALGMSWRQFDDFIYRADVTHLPFQPPRSYSMHHLHAHR